MENNIQNQNLALLEGKKREPKKVQFKDGEYVVPTKYVCTVCGQEYHVTKETAIKRINKQYDGEIKKWLANAKCSKCKAAEKIDEKIEKLQAQKAEIASRQVTE